MDGTYFKDALWKSTWQSTKSHDTWTKQKELKDQHVKGCVHVCGVQREVL